MSYTENDYKRLNYIREQTECMSKFNQIEILRILSNNKVIINENKYGIHVNLSDIDISILQSMLIYIKYVNAQENLLDNTEKEKQNIKNTFF